MTTELAPTPDHLHAKAAQTARGPSRRGTPAAFHETPTDDPKHLARPARLERATSRSVAPGEPQGARDVTPQMERVWNTARAVLTHTAAGAIPESAILALQEAVERLDLLQLVRDLRAAEGRLRPRVALSLALEVLSVVRPSVVGADSADSADSEVSKCL